MSIFSNGKRERGLIAYLQGLAYRVTMRVAHRYNWHYAPPLYPEGCKQLWCEWCGFRETIKTRPSLREIAVGLGCDMESTQVPPEISREIQRYRAKRVGKTSRCEHGKGPSDYCEPCGRVSGGPG